MQQHSRPGAIVAGVAVIAVVALLAVRVVGSPSSSAQSSASAGASAVGVPGPTPGGPSPTPGVVTVTGHALYELSATEFMFSDGSKTYHVTMDLATRCVNLRGKLLGGYQFVSQIAMVTSLPLTISGALDGSTIAARTVLLPTDKDAVT